MDTTIPTYPLYLISPLRMEVDGEGVTTLVTSYGCPLKCAWCINEQAKICREEIKRITVEELYDRVKAHNLYYLATGGGLTFGGGEPLLQCDFLECFFQTYQTGWKYNLETSLAAPWENVEKLIPYIDYYIVDCKSMNASTYQAYTGCSGQLMRENLQLLLKRVGADKIKVRIPFIPQYNTREKQEKSKEMLLAMGLTNIECFSYVLREFHKKNMDKPADME